MLPVEERAARLLRLRDAIAERAEEIVEVVSRECGKPRHEALVHEVTTLLDLAHLLLQARARACSPPQRDPPAPHEAPRERGALRPARRRGRHLALELPLRIPWATSSPRSSPATPCVVKPSEVTPLIAAARRREIYDSTGLAGGSLRRGLRLRADGTGAHRARASRYCVFTGGVETGKRVAAACGARLIPCVMELGGKAPLIACADCRRRSGRRAPSSSAASRTRPGLHLGRARLRPQRRVRAARSTRVASSRASSARAIRREDDVDVGRHHLRPGRSRSPRSTSTTRVAKGARLVCGGGTRVPGPGPILPADGARRLRPRDDGHARGDLRPGGAVHAAWRATKRPSRLANDSHLGLNAYVFTQGPRGAAAAHRRAHRSRERAWSTTSSPTTPPSRRLSAASSSPASAASTAPDALREMCTAQHISFDRLAPPARDPFWLPVLGQELPLAPARDAALAGRRQPGQAHRGSLLTRSRRPHERPRRKSRCKSDCRGASRGCPLRSSWKGLVPERRANRRRRKASCSLGSREKAAKNRERTIKIVSRTF